MGRCIQALLIKEPVPDVKPSTGSNSQIYNHRRLVTWYSAILRTNLTDKNDVEFFLERPGNAELVAMATIISDFSSSDIHALPSEVRDVAQQTLAILSRTANLHLDQPIAELDISNAKIDPTIVSGFRNLLQKCIPGASTLISDEHRSYLRISLKCLWRCAKEAYQRLDASESSSAYFFDTLGVASAEFIHLFQTEQYGDARVMGRCIGALAVMKLMTDVKSRSISRVQIGNHELACLSIILGTGSDDMKNCLEWPDTVELATILSLLLGDFGPFGPYGLRWMASEVCRGTFAILSQTIPVEGTVGWEPLDWTDIFNGRLVHAVVPNLHSLLRVNTSGASAHTANVRKSCLRMCLRNLWYCANAYHQPGNSNPLPSYFPSTLASPEIIHLIHVEQDPGSRAMGRCFGALVITKLAADWVQKTKKLAADSGSRTDSEKVKITDDELTCLSAILGIKSSDVEFCLQRPGAIELASMVSIALGDVGSLDGDALSSGARDVVQKTLAILCQAAKLTLDQPISQLNFLDGEFNHTIVSALNDLLQECISGTSQASPLTAEVGRSCLRMSLNCLWYCAKAYHQPGASKLLPSYFLSTLASPGIIFLIQFVRDSVSRVTGRCFGALAVMKLAVDIRSRADLNVQISDEELACLSGFFGIESTDLKIWLSQPCAIELATILSLISSEIYSLSSDKIPSEVLDIVQQTCSIINGTIPVELNVKLTNFAEGQCEVAFSPRLFGLNLLIRDLTNT